MVSRCPKCQKKIAGFAVRCAACGWHPEQARPEEAGGDDVAVKKSAAADAQLSTAIDAIDREDFPAAVSALNAAIIDADESQLPECYGLRGYALLKLRQNERAESDCSKAIELGHTDVETYAWRAAARGQLLNWRGAFDDLSHARKLADNPTGYEEIMGKYYEPAMSWFRQRLQTNPSQPGLHDDRGWIHYYLGEYAKAKRDFELALQQDPHYGKAMLGVAETNLALGLPEQAMEFAAMARQADKSIEGQSLICQIRAAHAAGRISMAIDSLQQLRLLAQRRLSLFKQCAELRLQIGDYVGAIEDFGKLIQIEPEEWQWYKLRGDTYAAINNPALAVADYSVVLRKDSSRGTVWVRRGEMNTQLRRYEKALRDFDRAGELGLLTKELLLGRARVYDALRHFDEAIDQCKKAQRLVPDSDEVFALEGAIYARQKIYTKALDQFSRAIELAEGSRRRAAYLYQRGIVYYELEQFIQAIEDLRLSHELRPNHAGTLIWRAAASSQQEDWPAVMDALQTAIAIRPSATIQYKTLGAPVAGKAVEYMTQQIQLDQHDAELYRNRGMAFQFLGSFEAAIEDYEASLALEEDPGTRIRLGQTRLAAGERDAAFDDFSRIIDSAVEGFLRHEAFYWRAKSRQAARQTADAIADVRQALALAPEHARYHAYHGELLRKSGEPAQAIEALTRAIALDFTDPLPYFLRGQLFLKQGLYLKAIIDFCQSLDLYPAQPKAIAYRGEAYLKSGQHQPALEDFELALTHDPTLVKAYCGRAQVLAARDQAEHAAIWLTKAIHRFHGPKAWSQLLLSRGKIFYQISRFAAAINDFTTVLEMKRQDPAARAAARYARAVAMVQQGQLVQAQKELERLLQDQPGFVGAQQALDWLATGMGPRPVSLHPPKKMIRPKRPPQVVAPAAVTDDGQWDAQKPFDQWVVRLRDPEKSEYGPVSKRLLDQWASEGRIPPETKLLRADWERWKRAAEIYPMLAPSKNAGPQIPSIVPGDIAATSPEAEGA